MAAPKPQVLLLCKIPWPTVKIVPLHVKFQDTEDIEEYKTLQDNDDQMDDCSEEQFKAPSENKNIYEGMPPVAVLTSMDIHSTSLKTRSEEGDFHVGRHRHSLRILTREYIK